MKQTTSNPCDKCGANVTTEFKVSDEVWTTVTHHTIPGDGEYADGYWCLSCFVKKAEQVLPDGDYTLKMAVRRTYYKELIKHGTT